MTQIPEYVKNEAKKELARRYLWDYCQLRYPNLYKEERHFLKVLTSEIQSFIEQNEKRFLVVNLPPRHYKSLTATNTVEWLFGRNSRSKVMTGSYNETLSTTFAKKVRDVIDEKGSEGVDVYNHIFPDTKVKYGQASKSLWSLEGSTQDSYLATSPTGTATGFGANYIIIDDIIKSAKEAYNPNVLEEHWSWLNNTMLSRTEGNDYKVILIMTRWAKEDLAGRVIDSFGDLVKVIQFTAEQEDGSMLCDDVLDRENFTIKTQEMDNAIVQANYNQKPIDVEGRLYSKFQTWDKLPEYAVKYNFTDTADTGKDHLCSVDYIVHEDEAYITDVVFTDEPMEVTEPLVAAMLHADEVNEATIESNNGGRGFARNVERILKEKYQSNKTVISWQAQTSNKEARILTSSAWVQKHVYMPPNWQSKYKGFHDQLMAYQAKGKNQPDDSLDVLASLYEKIANAKPVVLGKVR